LPKLPNEFPREFNLLPSQFIQNPVDNLSNSFQNRANRRKRSKIDNDLILIQTQDVNDSSGLAFLSDESAEEDLTDLKRSPPISSMRKNYSQSMYIYRDNRSTESLRSAQKFNSPNEETLAYLPLSSMKVDD
jgi:hypothetical protein